VVWCGKQVYVVDYVAITCNELQKMMRSMKAQASRAADIYRNKQRRNERSRKRRRRRGESWVVKRRRKE